MARSFNGTSDVISADLAASFSELAAYGVAFFVKGAADATFREVWCEAGANINAFIQLETNGSATNKKMLMAVRSSAGGTAQLQTSTTADVFDGSWHHFVYTQDGSGNWQAYVDGAADKSGHYTAGSTSCDRVRIGAGAAAAGGNTKFWNGLLAEVAKWDRQLSAGEAKLLGSGVPASHLAPDHYWPLWGVDSPEPDIGTATHISGTLTGTSAANGGRVGIYLLRKPGVVLPQGSPSVSKSDSDTASLSEANDPIQIAKTDTDDFSTADHASSLAAAVSGTDTASAASAVTSIALATTDTLSATSSQSVDQSGTDKSDTDEGTLSETSSVAATLTDTATATLSDSGSVTSTNVAISDSDDFSLDDTVFGTGSGGKADSFYGVVLALADDTFTANPDWVRFDDPVGVS